MKDRSRRTSSRRAATPGRRRSHTSGHELEADAEAARLGALRDRLGQHSLAMAVAVVTRIPGLGQPGVLVFDEQYYVPGAAEMLQWGAMHGLAKHPPLGWWLIASGIELFGFTPTGWRVASLIAGVATVGAVSAAARRLTGDQRLAFAQDCSARSTG